ncbi:uncharacterized protein [Haliotis asinina]|uniref:uncharacterized protein n=1 Tax=Haliotis asinina TaxID=109174 RepID=UPI003531A514
MVVSLIETSVSSSERMEGSCSSDESGNWYWQDSSLVCYLCGELFRRPRILPCGHTFCTDCLARLREEVIREGKLAGTYDPKHAEIGHFVCPMPECSYSMRLINLHRFTTKNKTVSEAVGAFRKKIGAKQDVSTQTDITSESIIVAIPKSLLMRTKRQRNCLDQASFVDTVLHRALSMDSLSRNYIPQGNFNWRSCVTMLGVSIIQQLIHI